VSRIATSNYLADADTQFAWATDANDFFSRTLDLAYLALAVERHTHETGRGLPVKGYATGSIPTSAIVANPIFPGTVSVAAGGVSVIGASTFTGNVTVTGNIIASGTISGAGAISTSVGGLSVAGTISTSTGGASITGNSVITGALTVTSTVGCGNIACGSITASGAITTTSALGAANGLNVTNGGMVIAGNSTINFGFLHVPNGAISAGGNISNTTGGADFFGTVNCHNDLTVFGNVGMLGNVGVTGVLQPGADLGSNLGDPALRWATLFANHLTIYGTGSYAGLQSFTAGISVSAGGIGVVGGLTVVSGGLSVTGTSGFAGLVQPASDNAYDLGVNAALRWRTVYAITGTIQSSSADLKEHLSDMSPELALDVVRSTKLYEFQYKQGDGEGGYIERKTKKHRRDRQVGFVAEDVHPLLLVGEGGVNGQNTASVALAAIQALSAQVEHLTARIAELEGTPRV
jgi:methylglyoxal synthase